MSKRALLTVSILIALATPALASAQSAENAQRNADKSDAGQRNAPVAIKYGEARGIVSNAFTGKALEGALIRVRESGETARTDSNGLYRFVGLQTGRYTLDISYLGFATAERRVRVRRGEVVVANINLGDKEDTQTFDTIEVRATALTAEAAALNQQRTADNISNVVSSDDMGRFPDITLADGLRRLPGISFRRESRTGDGQFISIRGLDSALDAVRINGVNVAAVGGADRSVALDVFTTEGISKVVVDKTLLPDNESVGIGGAVSIETLSPMQLGKNVAEVRMEGSQNQFADKLGYNYGGTISHIFGADRQFGFMLSGSIRHRNIAGLEVQATSAPMVLPSGYTDEANVPPTLRFPFEPQYPLYVSGASYGVYNTQRDNIGGTAAFDWRVTDNTRLSLTYNYSRSKTDVFTTMADVETDTRYANFVLNGDPRQVATPRTPSVTLSAESTQSSSQNNSLVFKGQTLWGHFTLDYNLGYVDGSALTPSDQMVKARYDTITKKGYLLPLAPTGLESFPFNISNNLFPYPLMTQNGYAAIQNPGNYYISSVAGNKSNSNNDIYSAKFDAQYDFDEGGIFRYVKAGFQGQQSNRESGGSQFYSYGTVARRPTASQKLYLRKV